MVHTRGPGRLHTGGRRRRRGGWMRTECVRGIKGREASIAEQVQGLIGSGNDWSVWLTEALLRTSRAPSLSCAAGGLGRGETRGNNENRGCHGAPLRSPASEARSGRRASVRPRWGGVEGRAYERVPAYNRANAIRDLCVLVHLFYWIDTSSTARGIYVPISG